MTDPYNRSRHGGYPTAYRRSSVQVAERRRFQPPRGFDLSLPVERVPSLEQQLARGKLTRAEQIREDNRFANVRRHLDFKNLPRGRPSARNIARAAIQKGVLGRVLDFWELWNLLQGPRPYIKATEVAGHWDWTGWTVAWNCSTTYAVGPYAIPHSGCKVWTEFTTTWNSRQGIQAVAGQWYANFAKWFTINGSTMQHNADFQAQRATSLGWKDPWVAPVSERRRFTWVTPQVMPALNPMALPIRQLVRTQPALPHWAVPYRVVNPLLVERTEFGNGTVPRTQTGGGSAFVTRGKGPFVPVASSHRRRPPERRVKEKKLILSVAAYSVLGRVLHGVTETSDVVWAIYRALPRDRQHYGRDRRLQDKMWTIYTQVHTLDWGKAVRNIILNQIEDMIYGRIGRLAGKANRGIGAATGVGRITPSTAGYSPEDLLADLGL